MTIKREELDRRKVDFSEVTTGQLLSPVHPGEILRDEFLIPMNLSVARLAQGIKVSEKDLDAIVHGILMELQSIPRYALVTTLA